MATVSDAARKAVRPLSVRADEFRAHPIPGIPNARVGTCYVNAADLVEALDFDPWLKVNPRVPKRNAKKVLTGHVVKGIQETLREAPQDFALKCLGLFVLTEKFEHLRKSGGIGELQITLSDDNCHGLCNGGHVYAAIRDFVEREGAEKVKDAFVRVHLYEGLPKDKVTEIAEGMNQSKQVDDPSLAALAGYFDGIRKVMRGKLGEDQIAYHQGDDGAYYITDIVRVIMFFNRERFDDKKHPNVLYRQQKKMMQQFKAACDSSPSPMELIIPHVPELLQLSDEICRATPQAVKDIFKFGLMKLDGNKKARAGSKEHRDTPLYFIGKTMDCKVPNGWLMPMLAAFRANVVWDLENGIFEWREPLNELLDEVIADLGRTCVQEHQENVKYSDIGKKASVYEQCYGRVERHLDKLEIERLRKAK